MARELAADLHLQLNVVTKIVDGVFLKILKHLMYGREVHVKNFGSFNIAFHQRKKLTEKPIEPSTKKVSEAKIVPKFKFYRAAVALVSDIQKGKAERLQKEKDANQHACKPI